MKLPAPIRHPVAYLAGYIAGARAAWDYMQRHPTEDTRARVRKCAALSEHTGRQEFRRRTGEEL